MTDAPQLPMQSAAGASAYRPYSPWRPLAGSMAAIVIIVASLLGYLAGLLSAMRLLLPDLNWHALGAGAVEHTPGLLVASLIAMLTAQLVAVLATALFAGRRGGRAAGVLALVPPTGGFGAYFVAAAFFCIGAVVLGVTISLIWPHDATADLKLYLPIVRSPYWWLLVVIAVVGAPLSEELLFRGFLFSCFAQTRLGLIGTTFVTSVLWASLHVGYSLQGLLLVFGMGLLLSAVLIRTGSTRVTMLCHGVYNAACMTFLMLYLA